MENNYQVVRPVKIIVYDFETNGFLDYEHIQPVELAAWIIDVDGSKHEIHKYIKCAVPLTAKLTSIHGISNEMLENYGEELCDVIGEFRTELEKEGEYCIVGHNILRYDNPLYNMMQLKLNCSHTIDDKKCFDTGGQFKGELMKWKKFDNLSHHQYHSKCLDAYSRVRWNLTAAGQYYGIKSSGIAHSAIGDIENNLQVFIKQLQRIGKVPENLLEHEII